MQIYYDTTCGILINNSNNEYLIGHVTLGKYWSLPKGCNEKNETWHDTVIRETFEETGLTLDTNKIKFLSITENYQVYKEISHTQIKHYALFKYNQSVDVDIKTLKCSSFFERITKNNKKIMLPELDRFDFVDKLTLLNKLNPRQAEIVANHIKVDIY